MNSTEKNNKVFIMGEIVSEASFSHEVYGEGFYELSVKVMRLSGQADILPVTVSERLIADGDLKVGKTLCAFGQFHNFIDYLIYRLLFYFLTAHGTVRYAHSCIKQSEIVVYLCYRADR